MSRNNNDGNYDMPSIQKGETTSLAVVESDNIFGYPYFTIRRWTLSDNELCMIVDEGEVRISGFGLLKLSDSIQTQTLKVLRVVPHSIASDRAGEPVVTGHTFREFENE